MVTFPRKRPGKPAAVSPDQARVEQAIVEKMANAGLRASVARPVANGFEITVTHADRYTALFTVHGAFYRDHVAGCVRRPDENPPAASAPLFRNRPMADPVPDGRTFETRDVAHWSLDPLVRLAASEAAAYALPAMDDAGLDGIERDLLDAMRLAVTQEGAPALLARLHGFLMDRARDMDDPALLDDAVAALNGAAVAPGPR